MIEVHSELEPPTDDTVLWRFMDLSKFVSLLQTSELYFPQLTMMQDKYEGRMTKPIADRVAAARIAQEKAIAEVSPGMKELLLSQLSTANAFDQMRASVFISCWHANEHESAAMWQLYLSSKEGVAVKTTYGHLKRALVDAPEIIIPAMVKYIDYTRDEFPGNNLFHQMVHKRKSFEHEREFRLIWWSAATQNYEIVEKKGLSPPGEMFSGKGYSIRAKLSELLQKVHVSPTADPYYVNVVKGILAQYNVSCPCERTDLFGAPLY